MAVCRLMILLRNTHFLFNVVAVYRQLCLKVPCVYVRGWIQISKMKYSQYDNDYYYCKQFIHVHNNNNKQYTILIRYVETFDVLILWSYFVSVLYEVEFLYVHRIILHMCCRNVLTGGAQLE